MPRMSSREPAVDTDRRPSVSFARPEDSPRHSNAVAARTVVPVGPGRLGRLVPELARGALHDEVNGFPVQSAKVQGPPLRDDILARDRLLDWLNVKIHHRMVLVLAEAGYGKTTLLADFARRTRLRTLWYRLDEDDRDWVTVLHHLVAAGREHDPSFAPRTSGMLSDTGVAGPARDAVVDMFVRELPAIADQGVVLILDDFHLVDDSADMKHIVRELLVRAPERMTIVFASRRAPSIPIAKLRATGEVAELRTDDLRFDPQETARLFSETYGRPLEPDVLSDLSARTEGWAASLQLVQTALRDRSAAEIRRFVRNLTGADQELYDYLAEEVVGDLPDDLQQFLMRTSILQVVTPALAEAVTGLSATDVRRLTTAAERFSLLSRRGSGQRDHLRYHPLVRDFLESRLEKSVASHDEVIALHRLVAAAAEAGDWRLACHHYAQIGDEAGVVRTIDRAVEEIIARGDVLVAEAYLAPLRAAESMTSHEVIRSRSEIRRGEPAKAFERAKAALDADPESPVALANLASIAYRIGRFDLAEQAAIELSSSGGDPELRSIGAGIVSMVRVSVDGDIKANIDELLHLRQLQKARGHSHHEGTTLLNLAILYRVRGSANAALTAAENAVALLGDDPSASEHASAQAVRGWALAHGGDLAMARAVLADAGADSDELTRGEILLETAEVEIWYGNANRAADLLHAVHSLVERNRVHDPLFLSASARLALRQRDVGNARAIVDRFDIGEPTIVVGNKAQQLSVVAHLALASGARDARHRIDEGIAQAFRQRADFWLDYCRLLLGVLEGPESLNREIRRLSTEARALLSVVAELVVEHLDVLGGEESMVVLREAERRQERWLAALRDAVEHGDDNQFAAASFLEAVGTIDDVGRLRRLSRIAKGRVRPDLGRSLARRVAERVYIEDQGRVAIRIGDRSVEGASVRRKVLSLLCFLISRPRFSATRDEVLDALWPEFEPSIALNSLNQTVYFLRRVIEPQYREDTSPGYVRHESDVVWLDRQLVSSRSQICGDFMRSLQPRPTPTDVERLVDRYRGPFALDFAYEEWAVTYREGLHSAYLQVVENALGADIASGHFDRGISVARRALAVDPNAEQIELSLLRLLRLSGAHAAAAEQYAHYSSVLRDSLGVEPPPLESL